MPRSWDTSVTSSSGSRSLREPRNAYAGYLAWRARVSEVSVVIPTMNEEASIGRVIDEVRKALGGRLLEILVVDTDSRDRTREIATAKGARVISEPRRGYGRAYQTGLRVRGTPVAPRGRRDERHASDRERDPERGLPPPLSGSDPRFPVGHVGLPAGGPLPDAARPRRHGLLRGDQD